jgi:hypothetical protein
MKFYFEEKKTNSKILVSEKKKSFLFHLDARVKSQGEKIV